ncbi:nuclear transport factor 2 family protein [Aspergillus affinis]|uniref:nuclear transport factor 2 family protein n=1 Tax=Aspergillus affinis TaxID=1070780 RepID=UPI0022FDB551|nr:polyketide cyclase [Aspergillus affinis]KAI9036137.1 polyketide cyclase [Aspergillus affinis]
MDLKSRAQLFLNTIVNKRETSSIASILHSDIELRHDDLPPMSKSEFIEFWPQLLAQSPDFTVDIQRLIAEGLQVWVYSRVKGRFGGGLLDDVHILDFDESGLLIRSKGMQREIQVHSDVEKKKFEAKLS